MDFIDSFWNLILLPVILGLFTFIFLVVVASLEEAEKRPILPVHRPDEELGLLRNGTPCEYLRNFTIEIMRDNEPIMNIDTELRHRVVWMKE
jgi:hypothetical protein